MIGSKATSTYSPHVSVAPEDRPVILIAPRWENAQEVNGEKLSPNEEIAKCFVDAIIAAGGLPLQMALNCSNDIVQRYISLADGIAIPGGPDVHPRCWGDPKPYDATLCCELRDSFELKLVAYALEAKKPIFTTCRGTQLMNVARGGCLCMNVPSLGAKDGMTQWRHEGTLTKPIHPVEVEENSMLWDILDGERFIQTNSAHHCCVDQLGEDVRVVARATDGIPEAIEVEGQPFALGVQWHPEYTWPFIESDFKLWKAFVEAAAAHRVNKL